MKSLSVDRHHGGTEIVSVDFSVNVNPYGPTAAMREAIARASYERYPDSSARSVREAIGARFNRHPGEVIFGNGACGILWDIARAFCDRTTTIRMIEPTFSEFRAAALSMGSSVVTDEPADIVYLCSPNNPTGTVTPMDEILALADQYPLVLLDQVFLSLSDQHKDLDAALPGNVIAVRSFTKDHAIPGIRAGYAIASRENARRIENARSAWSTSSVAQAAAIAALGEEDFVRSSYERLRTERTKFIEALCARGYEPHPTSTIFFLVPGMPRPAGFGVRDCASFGLPDFTRLAVHPAWPRLIDAL